MAVDRVQRRMAAILAADVVGYSRLMGVDEAATLSILKRHRQELIDPRIAEDGGRIVKLIGDGMLVEFPSVVNAVACAVEILHGMLARNRDVASDERMEFRIGVTVGDVIVDGDDIFGDGVNVAARLESIADPGGLAISAIARDHVGRRLDLAFEDKGEQKLKNIDQPIRVWKWHPAANSAATRKPPTVPSKTVFEDFPSLAVLPFQNMGGDSEQDYFADGVVEDVITALSRFKSFAVIARNSSFIYKGRAVDVRQVASELGVRYVLEGSVRRSANRLRITAQLVDGATGAHLWANKFDGVVEDIFDVQDKITESVVAVIEPSIQRAEIERSRRERPERLAAYDLYLRGLQKFYTMRPAENAAALELLDQAIELEPGYAAALAAAAHCLEHRVTMGWPQVTANDSEEAMRLAHAALSVAGDDAVVLARCGIVLLQVGGEDEQAIRILNRAIEVNPNNVGVQLMAGIGHTVAGSLDDAQTILRRAIRLSPGETFDAMTALAHSHLIMGHFEEALDLAGRSLAQNPNFNPTYWVLIAANAHLGRSDEARRALAALQAIAPGINLSQFRRAAQVKHSDRWRMAIEGMRLAGMQEA